MTSDNCRINLMEELELSRSAAVEDARQAQAAPGFLSTQFEKPLNRKGLFDQFNTDLYIVAFPMPPT